MPTNLNIPAPIFGAENRFYWGAQISTPQVPLIYSSMTSFSFVDVPSIARSANLDEIYTLGSFQRVQANVMDASVTVGISTHVQDASLLAMANRSSTNPKTGILSYYTFLFGGPDYATQVIGAKCESMELVMPRSGPVMANATFQALAAPAYGGSMPTASIDTADTPFYGYALDFKTSLPPTPTYTEFTQNVKQIRLRIENELERLPPTQLITGSTQTTQLCSSFIKEKSQKITVSFDLYQPITLSYEINDVCQSMIGLTAKAVDLCTATAGVPSTATRYLLVTIPPGELVFSEESLQAGKSQDLVSFSMTATATDYTIAYTHP